MKTCVLPWHKLVLHFLGQFIFSPFSNDFLSTELYCTVPVQGLKWYFFLSSEIQTGTKKWSAVTM